MVAKPGDLAAWMSVIRRRGSVARLIATVMAGAVLGVAGAPDAAWSKSPNPAAEHRLQAAKGANAEMLGPVACLEQQVPVLMQRRDANTRLRSELLSRHVALEQALAKQKAEHAATEEAYTDKLEKAQAAEQDSQKRLEAVKKCHRAWTIMSSVMCGPHTSIVSGDAMFRRDLESELAALKVEHGRERANAQTELDEIQSGLAALDKEMGAAETALMRFRATVGSLRVRVREGQDLIEALESALGDVDMSERGAAIIRTRIAHLDASEHASTMLLAEGRRLLAEQKLPACSA